MTIISTGQKQQKAGGKRQREHPHPSPPFINIRQRLTDSIKRFWTLVRNTKQSNRTCILFNFICLLFNAGVVRLPCAGGKTYSMVDFTSCHLYTIHTLQMSSTYVPTHDTSEAHIPTPSTQLTHISTHVLTNLQPTLLLEKQRSFNNDDEISRIQEISNNL